MKAEKQSNVYIMAQVNWGRKYYGGVYQAFDDQKN